MIRQVRDSQAGALFGPDKAKGTMGSGPLEGLQGAQGGRGPAGKKHYKGGRSPLTTHHGGKEASPRDFKPESDQMCMLERKGGTG